MADQLPIEEEDNGGIDPIIIVDPVEPIGGNPAEREEDGNILNVSVSSTVKEASIYVNKQNTQKYTNDIITLFFQQASGDNHTIHIKKEGYSDSDSIVITNTDQGFEITDNNTSKTYIHTDITQVLYLDFPLTRLQTVGDVGVPSKGNVVLSVSPNIDEVTFIYFDNAKYDIQDFRSVAKYSTHKLRAPEIAGYDFVHWQYATPSEEAELLLTEIRALTSEIQELENRGQKGNLLKVIEDKYIELAALEKKYE